MLDFADLPYQFVPPKPNALIISLVRALNRLVAMPGKNHRLTGIDLSGVESFAEAHEQKSARFVFLPNHPTHSDPHVMMEVCRRLKVKPAFMTAYDVFARSKLGAWVVQHTGAFSVDREGSDRKSLKCASDILTADKYPLVIFPEGNVYLCNDRVTPFNEGAAYIALRVQKELGEAVPVYVVPVSLKYTHVEDVRDAVRDELGNLASVFGTEFDREAPIFSEFKRISVIALARILKQHGHIPPESHSEPDEQVSHAARQIIESLESKMELSPRATDDLVARVRKIRAAVHSVRTDPSREIDHRAASHWADEAILALRILGYAGGYAASSPTLDRVAETIARLHEDVTFTLSPPAGKRLAFAHICEPIDLRDHLAAFNAKARTAVGDLTDLCEEAVQAGIDQLNQDNTHPGRELF